MKKLSEAQVSALTYLRADYYATANETLKAYEAAKKVLKIISGTREVSGTPEVSEAREAYEEALTAFREALISFNKAMNLAKLAYELSQKVNNV